MNKLKKDLKNKFYIEAPDQLEDIKSKVSLKPSNSVFNKLKRQNLYLRYSNIVFSCLLLILGLIILGQITKSENEIDQVSITEYIDVTLRSKVREENIIEITGVILPYNDSDKTLFIQTFNNFKLQRFNLDVYLDEFDYLYYKISFIDNSNLVVKVYENNIVCIEIEGNYFYSFEHNAYDILK